MEPYKVKLKTKQPVYIKQYPLSKDKELGIKPLIDNFVQQGVLVPTHSPYNTPINPVGYVDSPAVFSAVVQRTLAKMTDLPSTVCVLQYADDLIISSETHEDCEKASIIVCNVLAQTGFKASKENLQWVQPKVTYLGHIIMTGLRVISTDRVQMIRKMKSPQTVQQLQSFLGLAPLKTPLNWTDEAKMHFTALKKAITTAPSLGLPNFLKEFHLHVRETEGVAMGVLLQQHGSTYRPVASSISTTIESDNGTPFASRVTQFLARSLSIDWHFSIPYHPQSCSNVERLNKTIKGQLNKAVLETGKKKWVDLLSVVLTEIRMTPSSTTKLSPFEILMGRPFPTPWVKGHTGIASLGDLEVIQEDYVTSLIEKLNSICADVSLCLPLPSEKPTHPFVPGQSVLIKSLKLTRIGELKYLGPATVITVNKDGSFDGLPATVKRKAPI
ncbi:Gag-Pol polyprotein [Labeo rohita]|uniref:ribonuclease H n=1 Tax=Labeo rohita TaxID=84645 RepID=A0ABQ8KZL1_LABRO|nr:Gag-Pol polyprotein [Labeo rohita]